MADKAEKKKEEEKKPYADMTPEKLKELYEFRQELTHTELDDQLDAYAKVKEKYLRNPKTGRLNYSNLKDEQTREKFANDISSHMLEAVKKRSKSNPDNVFYENTLFQAYVGATQQEIKDFIKRQGPKYTWDVHIRNAQSLTQKQAERMDNTLYGMIQREHMGGVLEYIVKERPDVAKYGTFDINKMELSDARSLLASHFRGELKPEELDTAYFKKKEEKKEKYDQNAAAKPKDVKVEKPKETKKAPKP